MTNIIKNIEEHIFHFGLDHLEIYATSKDELLMTSDEVEKICGYYIRRVSVEKYLYKIIFYKDKYDYENNKNHLFAYYKWIWTLSIPTRDYIIIYSTWFRLISEDKILFFLDQFNLLQTKRFDIAVDILKDIQEVLNTFKEINQKSAVFNWTKWEIETLYIWEKKYSKNKRQLIRVYDKIKDIRNKKKNEIYANYLVNEPITRIEIEVRSELAKNVYFLDLFNNKILLRIFKNYIHKHCNIFDELPWEKITLYKKKYAKIDPELYQSTYYRDKRKNIFIWHAKLVFNLWYCPIRVLIAEWLIKDTTKDLIWIDNFEKILEKEKRARELAKEEKYIRENIHEILNNLYKYGRV